MICSLLALILQKGLSCSNATMCACQLLQDCVPELRDVCESEYKNFTILDTAVWRRREELVRRMNTALGKIGVL